MKCPVCGNEKSKEVKSSGFQFMTNRECTACGTVYQPPCPKWGGIACIVVGLGFLVAIGLFLMMMLQMEGRGFGITGAIDGLETLLHEALEALADGELWVPLLRAVQLVILVALVAGGVRALSYGIKVLIGKKGTLTILKEGKLS